MPRSQLIRLLALCSPRNCSRLTPKARTKERERGWSSVDSLPLCITLCARARTFQRLCSVVRALLTLPSSQLTHDNSHAPDCTNPPKPCTISSTPQISSLSRKSCLLQRRKLRHCCHICVPENR